MAPMLLNRWMPLMSCVCLTAGLCAPVHAQLAISLDDEGSVSLQNGSQPPLVVGPGQSFGGTLTPKGFQGVMSDSQGNVRSMHPGVNNPFRTAPPAASRTAPQPLQINAGGVSVSLPGVSAPLPPKAQRLESLTMEQLASVKQMMRNEEPVKAMREIERLMKRSPSHPELLQMKAILQMQDAEPRDAAACVYEVMAQGSMWTWPMLRSCFSSRESVEVMYRNLQKELSDSPTADRLMLRVWWEKMLGHDPEAVAALEQLCEMMPKDVLLDRLAADWAAMVATDAPPAVQP